MLKKKVPFTEAIKEAFLLKLNIPHLGDVPINLVTLAAMFTGSMLIPVPPWQNPLLWVTALGEAGYLALMSLNPKFHRYINLKKINVQKNEWEIKKKNMLSKLSPGARTRYKQLEDTARNILKIYETHQRDGRYIDPTKTVVVNQLVWFAIKLLVSRETIVKNIKGNSKDLLEIKIRNMEKNLQSETNERLRKTLESTIDTMKKRLESINSVTDKIKGIDLELLRIEEQLALLSNVAAIDTGKSHAMSEQIDSAQDSILAADEWMKTNEELFSSLDSDFQDLPTGDIVYLVSEEKTI